MNSKAFFIKNEMAELKKSFLLYTDLIHTVSKLPNDKAGELFKHILSYVNDENPVTEDILIQVSFEPIKQQLKRDLDKWDEIRDKRSKAGKKSAEKRAKQKATLVENVEHTLTNSTVNDNVNVNVNVINKKKVKFNYSDALISEGAKENLVKDWLLVRKNKKATNTETSFNSFMSEVKKSKLPIDKVLKICIERDWKGFNAEWVKDYEQENKVTYNFKVK